MNYLNSLSKYTSNINFEIVPKKGQNQLLTDVISSFITILNDGNKKEQIKPILEIIMKIIKYFKSEEDKNQNKNKNKKMNLYMDEFSELILNTFLF